MGMQDHLDKDGNVTKDTITQTAAEQAAIARDGQVDAQASGDTYLAGLYADAVDMNLDRINDHK